MIKLFLILSCCCLCTVLLFAQKPPITPDVIEDWPQISNEAISNDGNVAVYRINRAISGDTLVIQATNNRWIEKIANGQTPVIIGDNSLVLYRKRDSLFLFDVQHRKIVHTVAPIVSFRSPATGKVPWIAWLQPDRKLTLYNFRKKQAYNYNNIITYVFSATGATLLLQQQTINNNDTTTQLLWINTVDGRISTVLSKARRARNFKFDEDGVQLAFLTDESYGTTLRYFRKDMDSAIIRVHNHSAGIDSNYILVSENVNFSPNGKRLFLGLQQKDHSRLKQPGEADVNIWHYDDDLLVTEKISQSRYDARRVCTAVINTADSNVVQIDGAGDDPFVQLAGEGDAAYALVRRNHNFFAGSWKPSTIPEYYTVNLNTGERSKVLSQRDIDMHISPGGLYTVWYDPCLKTWFSRHNPTGKQQEITPQLKEVFSPRTSSQSLKQWLPYGVAGWLSNDEAIVLYDQFDLWKCDLAGIRAPVNLTNGYGRQHGIVLRLWLEASMDKPVNARQHQTLVAFDTLTKSSGFFKASLMAAADPVKLWFGPEWFNSDFVAYLEHAPYYPTVKARHATAFLLRGMNSGKFPNVYFSKDLKTFAPLSQLQPQQAYNWLTTALINFEQRGGGRGSGILYKPEDFDAGKKYPVIFYMYEKLTHRLNYFLHPELSIGGLDIPWYVSRGYLVCTPDINYTAGYTGESALQTLEAAAAYLGTLPYVDSTKIGLQGHSFGGYQVNYIVSHSNKFAAAQESAGASDFISYYNGNYREHSAQFYFETGQGRIGKTLWEQPELYIQNSPVFNANQVQTPLLIMHNKGDEEVPFQQGLEWFTALRRLGKKVWMLQYDKEYHGIYQPQNMLDFTKRQTDFFDHYLKGTPPPKWMIQVHEN